MRMLTTEEARRFYDRFGARQDSQGFYEDAATADLVAHAAFAEARAVAEFGCGTGRFARRLLGDELPTEATYVGFDQSSTMCDLTRERLAPFGDRARVVRTDGGTALLLADGACDRFVSNFVFDLLPEAAIEALLREAHRVLAPGGRLCITGLTHGATAVSKAVTALLKAVHALRPALVGGCRPVAVADHLDPAAWEVLHRRAVTAWGISSEVLVAGRR